MAGAALVHNVWTTTPAETQKLARRPSTKAPVFTVALALGRPRSHKAGVEGAALIIVVILALRWGCSELRAAIDPNGVAGDPAGVVGGKEGDHATDIVRC